MKKTALIGAVLGASTFVSFYSPEAHAIEPIKSGTFTVAAERMMGFGVYFPQGGGDANVGVSLLLSGAPVEFQYPRIGIDYFVIDGLSIGGHLGLSYASYGGGADVLAWTVQPRVGYAFALSESIDFWPRVGLGIIGGNSRVRGPFNNSSSWVAGLLTVEAMFVWNIVEHVGMEFGPTLDAGLGDHGVGLGANVGLLAKF